MQLRPYQLDLKNDIYQKWIRHKNVCAVMPTGAGKTVLMANVVHEHVGHACVIAHRQELVGQISIALAREGVRHNIVGPTNVIKRVVRNHIRELGRSFYDINAKVAVAGVDTLIRRESKLANFCNKVTLWVIDEGHHVVRDNKWGTACAMFPNAKGLLVTATPCRSDGKGLGRHADGVIDVLVEGPSMRWLIENGFLTEYRIFAPRTEDLILDDVPIGKDGDYNKDKLKKAIRRSHMVGDVVKHYLKIAAGKRGVTFCTDVETATEIAEEYCRNGVPARMVCATTPDEEREDAVAALRDGRILQITNVDLFGEGFDLPAIEVISMARPTASYGLYCQQFGRSLRLLQGKLFAIIIDHTSNVIQHGLPDREREWSLDARAKTPKMKNPDDDIPMRYCVSCTQPYSRLDSICPYCKTPFIPASRSKPEHVDGDLFELTPEVLESMRRAVASADRPPDIVADQMRRAGAPEAAWRGALKQLKNKQGYQMVLRDTIAWWAAWQKDHEGLNDSQIYRKFYLQFGTDILTAQTLGQPDTVVLTNKLSEALGRYYAK